MLLLALLPLVMPLRLILAWFIAVTVHELGHLITIRLLGVPVHSIRIGFLGVRIDSGPMTPAQQLLSVAAGPAAGLSLSCLGGLWPELAVFAFVQSLWNLLPVHPLDGGRILHALAELLDRSWAYRVCQWLEITVLFLVLLAGIGAAYLLRLGWMPLTVSIWAILRLWKEKDLANGERSGYNIPNPNSEVCYDRVNSTDPAHGAETCPIYRR